MADPKIISADDIWTDVKTPPEKSPQSEKIGEIVIYRGERCEIVSVDDSGPNPITIRLPDLSEVKIARSGQYFDPQDETLKSIRTE